MLEQPRTGCLGLDSAVGWSLLQEHFGDSQQSELLAAEDSPVSLQKQGLNTSLPLKCSSLDETTHQTAVKELKADIYHQEQLLTNLLDVSRLLNIKVGSPSTLQCPAGRELSVFHP